MPMSMKQGAGTAELADTFTIEAALNSATLNDAIQRYTAIIFVDKHGGPDASSSNATAALGSRKSTLSSLQVIVADNSAELGLETCENYTLSVKVRAPPPRHISDTSPPQQEARCVYTVRAPCRRRSAAARPPPSSRPVPFMAPCTASRPLPSSSAKPTAAVS